MVKGCSFLVFGFLLLLAMPICIGIGGGIFGMIFGIIGGVFGMVFGIIGAIFGFIADIFGGIMHALFGWHHHDFHPWHFNGLGFLAIIILICVVASRKKNN